MKANFVSFMVKNTNNKVILYGIGSEALLYAFFYNIQMLLEKGKIGSIYPVFMNKLYQGYLKSEDLVEAKNELHNIKNELAEISLNDLLFEYEKEKNYLIKHDELDVTKKSADKAFITNTGRELIEVIEEAFDDAIMIQGSIHISAED